MNTKLLLLTLCAIFLVGCSGVSSESDSKEQNHEDPMANMPCHMMPDGSLMGDCQGDEFTVDDGHHDHSSHPGDHTDDHIDEMGMLNQTCHHTDGHDHTEGDDHALGFGCGDFSNSSTSDMMHNANAFLAGDYSTKSSFSQAKSSTIVSLADGEEYSITADIITKEINGKEFTLYGYNGMIPGPALKVEQGSTVYINFTNNIDLNTTVHWHGLRHDIMNDGVPGVSQDPVAPGESFRYELYFPDDGLFWYHPHIREDIQQDSGLAGNMLVVPEDPYNPVNREELIVLDDILVDEEGYMVPFGKDHANFAVMGRYGNVMLTNGETDYSLEVDKGDVVRLYVTNVANVRPFNISIEGAVLKHVGGDLGQFEREEFVDSVILAPAMRSIIDVYFEEAGSYDLLHTNPHHTYTLGTFEVSTKETSESHLANHLSDVENQAVIDDIATFAPYFDKEIDYQIDLTIDMMGMMDAMADMPCHLMGDMVMGSCSDEEREALTKEADHGKMSIEWEDEMKMRASAVMVDWILEDASTQLQNMDIEMKANVGDVVKVRLFNDPESMHPMQHPIHLHGQRFVVTEIDGEAVDNKVWTDTVLVPIGSTVDILIDVTNPGEWMMHCHIAEHLEAGMMASFMVEE